MKITIVQGAFFPVPAIMGGAVEKAWYGLGREFAAQGHEVVHISRRHPKLPDRELEGGVSYLRLPGAAQPRSLWLLKLRDLLYTINVIRHLPNADIVVSNTFWLPVLLRGTRKGLIYINVNRYPRGQMKFYRHAARIQAVSGVIRDAIVEQTPQVTPITNVIPNPLPIDFQIPEIAAPRTRGRWNILFVGRIHPEKGIEILLEAFARLLRNDSVSAHLTIVGPHLVHQGGAGSAFLADMKQRAENVERHITWAGPIFESAELKRHYTEAHFLVYPSVAAKGEASPLTPVEAMAMGCLPVVSDLDCFKDYMEPGKNGFVFELSGSPAAALGDALHHAIKRTDLDEMRVQALSTARRYTSREVAAQHLNDFTSLLPKR